MREVNNLRARLPEPDFFARIMLSQVNIFCGFATRKMKEIQDYRLFYVGPKNDKSKFFKFGNYK